MEATSSIVNSKEAGKLSQSARSTGSRMLESPTIPSRPRRGTVDPRGSGGSGAGTSPKGHPARDDPLSYTYLFLGGCLSLLDPRKYKFYKSLERMMGAI